MDIHLFPVMKMTPMDYRIHGLEESDFEVFKRDIISDSTTGRYFFPIIGLGASLEEKVLFVKEEILLGVFDRFALFVDERDFQNVHMLLQAFSLKEHIHIIDRCKGMYSLDILIYVKDNDFSWFVADHSFCRRKIEPGVFTEVFTVSPLFN